MNTKHKRQGAKGQATVVLDASHPAFLLQQRFRFLERLNKKEAGFGEVYLVQGRENGERWALKIPKPPKDEVEDEPRVQVSQQMLRNEARLLADLSHPNLIRLVEDHSAPEEAWPYLLLEFVDGCNLREFLEEPVPPADRCRIAMGVVAAVAHLNAVGWLHNDLNYGNVMVDHLAAWPILIDLGLTSRPDGDSSHKQHGVPELVHPDVADGKPYSQKTENYQLAGITRYVLENGDLKGADRPPLPADLSETLVDLRESPTPATDTETLLRQLAIYQLQLLEETPGSTS